MKLTLAIDNVDRLPDGGPMSITATRHGIDIGRDPSLDWTLPDPEMTVSGRHCEVRWRDGAYWLVDVSRNGTFLNDAPDRLPGPHRLAHGDRLEIGPYVVTVALEGAHGAPAPLSPSAAVPPPGAAWPSPPAANEAAPGPAWTAPGASAGPPAGGASGWSPAEVFGGPVAGTGAPFGTPGGTASPVDDPWAVPPAASPVERSFVRPSGPAAPVDPPFPDWVIEPPPHALAAPDGPAALPAETDWSVPSWPAPPAPPSPPAGDWNAQALAPPAPPRAKAPPATGPGRDPVPAPPADAPGTQGADEPGPPQDDRPPESGPGPQDGRPAGGGAGAFARADGATGAAAVLPRTGDGGTAGTAAAAAPGTAPADRPSPSAAALAPAGTPPAGTSPPPGDAAVAPHAAGPAGGPPPSTAGEADRKARPGDAAGMAATDGGPAPAGEADRPAGEAARADAFLEAFAAAAGVPVSALAGRDAAEVGTLAGRLLNLTAANLQDLVAGRAAAKSLARSRKRTMVAAVGNDPIKFSPGPEEALRIVLGPPTRSYLQGEAAFSATFSDIKTHQLETLAAMRYAANRLLEELSPDTVEAEADGSGGFLASRKARLWDAYVARWKARAEPHENGMLDCFMLYFSAFYDEDR